VLENRDLLKAFAHFQKYKNWLIRQPLSEQTKRAYRSRINSFLGFLAASGEDLNALVQNEQERKFVLLTYKRQLKQEFKLAPATVNANLTALDHFFQFLGTSISKIEREDLPQEAPRALDKKSQQAFLRAVSSCRRSKDRAIALLIFYSGIRISECASLDVDDISVIGRKNQIIVRDGKGSRFRQIPLHQDAREAIKIWLDERAKKFDQNDKFYGKKLSEALFLNPQGNRMSTASIDRIVRLIGSKCGLELSAHVLRHSCLTNLVRNGNDVVLVAEIAGHKRLETTRKYALPTAADKRNAIESL